MGVMRNFRKLFNFIHESDNYYSQYSHVRKLDLNRLGIYSNLKKEIGDAPEGILDFGSGLGYITNYLGAEGVDINIKAVAAARDFFPGTKFMVKTVKELSEGKKYSAITCVNVIEHLEDGQRREWFEAVPKILADGGKLYVVYDSMYHPAQLLSGLIHPGMLLTDPSHVHCWTQGQFRKILGENFDIVKEKPGNILALFLPLTNIFASARMYVCVPKKGR